MDWIHDVRPLSCSQIWQTLAKISKIGDNLRFWRATTPFKWSGTTIVITDSDRYLMEHLKKIMKSQILLWKISESGENGENWYFLA